MEAFQSCAVPLTSAVAIVLPSGLYVTPFTPMNELWVRDMPVGRTAVPFASVYVPVVLARREATGFPVAVSHSWTVPSASAVAIVLPSGLYVTPFTPLYFPLVSARSDAMGCPAATSHSRTIPVESAVASVLPSGLNATADTGPVAVTGKMPCCWAATRVSMAVSA